MTETISIENIYKELKEIKKEMATKKDFETLLNTIEIMSNEETMQQIKESESDIIKGRVRKLKSIKDLISEM